MKLKRTAPLCYKTRECDDSTTTTPAEMINNQGSENHQLARTEPFEWFKLATLSTYTSELVSENSQLPSRHLKICKLGQR